MDPRRTSFYLRRDRFLCRQGRGRASRGSAPVRPPDHRPSRHGCDPRELRPFLDPDLTRRKLFDFSDVSTSAVGRRWAEIDERVLYVENPHPRLVLDPNRMPPGDLEAGLREAFRRVRSAGPGRTVDLDGVDAVRPVTFAFAPVLVEPRDTAGWRALLVTLRECAVRGAGLYVANAMRCWRRCCEPVARPARHPPCCT